MRKAQNCSTKNEIPPSSAPPIEGQLQLAAMAGDADIPLPEQFPIKQLLLSGTSLRATVGLRGIHA